MNSHNQAILKSDENLLITLNQRHEYPVSVLPFFSTSFVRDVDHLSESSSFQIFDSALEYFPRVLSTAVSRWCLNKT